MSFGIVLCVDAKKTYKTNTRHCSYCSLLTSSNFARPLPVTVPVSSDKQHMSYDGCLEVRGRDCQNCSVLYCVLKLCTVRSTLRWAVLTVLWIGFCHTGPISLCIDWFVLVCVYFECFCYIRHICCITASTVGSTWWDWSLILRTYLPSVLWHCWLGHLTRTNLSPIWPAVCSVGR